EKDALRKQLAQAQKMESIGRLAGGVAHDFNNLLTAITGNISLAMLDISPEDPVCEVFNEVSRAAESAASLTRQLLAFSRKQQIEPKVLSLNDVIESSNKMLRRLIGEDIELVFEPAKDLWSVNIDPGQVEHILVNLVVNARDAMPDGGRLSLKTANVTLDDEYCRSHTYTLPGPYVMLQVADDGIGMDEQVLSQVFEPFFTTKAKGKGTGLGLATVYGAVKQNHGTIEVDSEPGRGSRFTIYLPRAEGEAERISPLARSGMPSGTETVLVVEDEALVRGLAVRTLRRQGYRVHAFANGGEALMAVREMNEPIHLLMTDVIMPGVNGKVLAENIQAIVPDIQVLFTSGYTDDVISQHGVLQEGIEFIAKPYTPQSLAKRVRTVLDRNRPRP
ncbi:MAG: ATP-binding protein, partial [Myxococcota bacterium]